MRKLTFNFDSHDSEREFINILESVLGISTTIIGDVSTDNYGGKNQYFSVSENEFFVTSNPEFGELNLDMSIEIGKMHVVKNVVSNKERREEMFEVSGLKIRVCNSLGSVFIRVSSGDLDNTDDTLLDCKIVDSVDDLEVVNNSLKNTLTRTDFFKILDSFIKLKNKDS